MFSQAKVDTKDWKIIVLHTKDCLQLDNLIMNFIGMLRLSSSMDIASTTIQKQLFLSQWNS